MTSLGFRSLKVDFVRTTADFLDERNEKTTKEEHDVVADFDNSLRFTPISSIPLANRVQDERGSCRPFPNDRFRQNSHVYFEQRSPRNRISTPILKIDGVTSNEGALAIFYPVDHMDSDVGTRRAGLKDVLSLLLYLFEDRRIASCNNEYTVKACNYLRFAVATVCCTEIVPSLPHILESIRPDQATFTRKYVTFYGDGRKDIDGPSAMVLHFDQRDVDYRGLDLTLFLLLAKILIQSARDSLVRERSAAGEYSQTNYQKSLKFLMDANIALNDAIEQNDLITSVVKSTFHKDLESDKIGRQKMFFPDEMLKIMRRKDPSLENLEDRLFCTKKEWKDGTQSYEKYDIRLLDAIDPIPTEETKRFSIRKTSAKRLQAHVIKEGEKCFEITFENKREITQRGRNHLNFDKFSYREEIEEVEIHVNSNLTDWEKTIVAKKRPGDGTIYAENNGFVFHFTEEEYKKSNRKEPKYIKKSIPEDKREEGVSIMMMVTKTKLHITEISTRESVVVQGHRDKLRSKFSNDPPEDLSGVYSYKFYVITDPTADIRDDILYFKETNEHNKKVLRISPDSTSDDHKRFIGVFPVKLRIYDKQTVTVTDTLGRNVPPQNMHKIYVEHGEKPYLTLGQYFHKFLEKNRMLGSE